MSITLLQTKLNILLCAEFLDLVVLVQDKKYHASVSILLPKKKKKTKQKPKYNNKKTTQNQKQKSYITFCMKKGNLTWRHS